MKKKFRILHTEWSEGFGGQEMRILLEIQEHLKEGHQVFLLAPPESPLLRTAREKGIESIPLKIRHTLDFQALRQIKKIIQENQIEVIHTHSSVDSWVASLAGKWTRVPVVVRTRHISVPTRRRPLNYVYALPDAVITTGEQIRQTLITRYGLPAQAVYSIPTGVDTQRFYPRPPDPALKQKLGLPAESLVISLVAVLRAQKRHEVVIAAAAGILKYSPRVRFLFVGEGPRRALIEEAIRRHGLESHILMTGHRNDIPEILALTDIGIISSQAEGVPQFLLQAMAMAKPVVSTAVGGIPDIITDGLNGLLIPPEEPQALGKAVIKILEDPNYARGISQKALKTVLENYNSGLMADKVSRVYRFVYDQKRRTH